MPDMSLPWTHLESLADDWEFKVQESAEEGRRKALASEIYAEHARKLRRAIEEEKRKSLSAGGQP